MAALKTEAVYKLMRSRCLWHSRPSKAAVSSVIGD